MYDKCTPKQQNGLIYGLKLRNIGAVQGLLGAKGFADYETFTESEREQIKRICTDAKARAKQCFEETRDRLDRFSETSNRTTPVERQYNGK